MKYYKFRELAQQYPWLIDIIDPLGYMRHDGKAMPVQDQLTPELRDFVRQKIEYVAFRPWETLPDPMGSTQGSYETTQTLEYALRCDPYFGGKPGYNYHVEWEIVYKVDDRQYRPALHRDGHTLCESMIEIQMDHDRWSSDEELVFTHLVKRISDDGKTSVEIFTIPEDSQGGVDYGDINIPPSKMCERDLLAWRKRFQEEFAE